LTLVIGSISGAHLGGKIARRWKGEAIRMVFCSILVALAGLMLARLVLIPRAAFVWEVTR
ncbi:MAG: sulfite exporter TauE/SafE family protein, partial [Holosporales bacterium]